MQNTKHISAIQLPDLNLQAANTDGTGTDSDYLTALKVLVLEKVAALPDINLLKHPYKRDMLCLEAKRQLQQVGHSIEEELDYCFPDYDHAAYIAEQNEKEQERREKQTGKGQHSESDTQPKRQPSTQPTRQQAEQRLTEKAEPTPVEPEREKHPFEQLHFATISPEAVEIFITNNLSGSDWGVYAFLTLHINLETGITNKYSRNGLASAIPDLHRTTVWRSLKKLESVKLITPRVQTKNNDTPIAWEVAFVAEREAIRQRR